METSLLSQSVWLDLPLQTRAKLANLFDFPEKGSVQVVYGAEGPKVLNDGYGYDHLKLITMEKMQQMLPSDSDNFYHLFGALVKNLDAIIGGVQFYDDTKLDKEEVIEVLKITEEIPVAELPVVKKRGRPRKTI